VRFGSLGETCSPAARIGTIEVRKSKEISVLWLKIVSFVAAVLSLATV
jgi:hypothetical protein